MKQNTATTNSTATEQTGKASGWTKMPPIEEGSVSCLTCGCGAHSTMSMERLLGVGFGDVTVSRDGEQIYSEMDQMHKHSSDPEGAPLWEGQDAEDAALKDPNHDWRVHFYAPLYEAEYQRQGDKHWPLVRKGMGFA